ncbi:MAG: tRNA pseudouridine(54/55) synthase Pus10 [Candidatus Thermoplasmatota archaeon]|jgi:tRNA pseudouridine synthase 10|nr:tRNA pseudouridine(54/55) synthase Pus10 [Candidatus Thermoplasmatota archaeon]
MDLREELEKIGSSNICTRCIGRVFAKAGHGLTNLERGEKVIFTASALGINLNPVDEKRCSLCHGLFTQLNELGKIVKGDLEKYEFSSFLVGSEASASILEMEKKIASPFNSYESIKKEFNREFGKVLFNLLRKDVDLSNPDIIITVSLDYLSYRKWIKSLYIRGKYRKLVRGIPQTRWVDDSIQTSVEEIIGKPAAEASGATNFYLHAAGREDVDVLMLGSGRSFVLELSSPEKRSIDLNEIARKVNSSKTIEISDLLFVPRNEVAEVKESRHDKTYMVSVTAGETINRDLMQSVISQITGKVIYQRTPLRVSHRRADLIRERTVKNASIVRLDENQAIIEITAEAGTYIKELVTGDGGRTNPSLSSLYGSDLRVAALDVTDIKTEE